MTIDERYEQEFAKVSDMQAHMPKLRDLASRVETVVEFGVRAGISTIALLAGRPRRMRSYDLYPSAVCDVLPAEVCSETDFAFTQADTRTLAPQATDLLMIDTLHTAAQLAVELRIHGASAKRIVLHDTATWGEWGEDGGPGLMAPLQEWLRAHPDWSVEYETQECNGLLVVGRR